MRVFHGADALPAIGGSVVSIGNFDGVHCGHQHVLRVVRERASQQGLESIAVTFSPHPARVLAPERDFRLLTPETVKLELLASTGIDATLVLPFTAEFSRLTAVQFAREYLRDKLSAVEVHEGESFHFGRGAQGTLASLTELGFATFAYAPVLRGGHPVSSSRIRGLVSSGDVSHARQLLGYPFFIAGETATGRGVGSTQTVPTLNLAEYRDILPGDGVYVTEVDVLGQTLPAVTNIGIRPTFGESARTVESHALTAGLPPVPPGTPLRVHFLHRLRDEQKWPSPEALRAQIGKDVARAQRFFALRKLLR